MQFIDNCTRRHAITSTDNIITNRCFLPLAKIIIKQDTSSIIVFPFIALVKNLEQMKTNEAQSPKFGSK